MVLTEGATRLRQHSVDWPPGDSPRHLLHQELSPKNHTWSPQNEGFSCTSSVWGLFSQDPSATSRSKQWARWLPSCHLPGGHLSLKACRVGRCGGAWPPGWTAGVRSGVSQPAQSPWVFPTVSCFTKFPAPHPLPKKELAPLLPRNRADFSGKGQVWQPI